jgi:hypothetical protein
MFLGKLEKILGAAYCTHVMYCGTTFSADVYPRVPLGVALGVHIDTLPDALTDTHVPRATHEGHSCRQRPIMLSRRKMARSGGSRTAGR